MPSPQTANMESYRFAAPAAQEVVSPVAAAGDLVFAGGVPVDTETVVISDAYGNAVTFEFTAAAAATGSVTITAAVDGDLIDLEDGVAVATQFEFDDPVHADGNVAFNVNPNDADTVTVEDGDGTTVIFEMDAGVVADGSVTLTAGNAADGDRVDLDDGVDTIQFEIDDPVHADGNVDFTANLNDGDTVTVEDGDGTVIVFEGDGGVQATGTVTIAGGNSADGDLIEIDDGVNVATEFEVDDPQHASGTIDIAVLPLDADTITIDDGQGTSLVFEFESGGGIGGDVQVDIAALDPTTTRDNLVTAINGTALLMVAAPGAGDDLTLLADEGGISYNVAIVESTGGARVVVAGMTLGAAAVASGGGEPVMLGATNLRTTTFFVAAVNNVGGGLAMLAADAGAGVTNLTNDAYLAAGNVAIDTSGATNTTDTEMTGGFDPGDGPIGGDVAFAIGAAAADTIAAFIVVVNASALLFTASPGAADSADIDADEGGVAHNVVILESTAAARITATGMVNGVAAAATAPSTAVLLGSTYLRTTAFLTVAINAEATLDSTAVDAGGGVITLTQDGVGVAGNTVIQEIGANYSKVDYSGGLNAGDGPITGDVAVAIGVNAAATEVNFRTAVAGTALLFTATIGAPDSTDLDADEGGVAHNVAILESTAGARIVATGMLNGAAAVAAGGGTPVLVGGTAARSAALLTAEINTVGAGLAITAVDAGGGVVNLTNDAVGTAGNVAIVETGANIVAVGMQLGTDLAITAGNTAVTLGATAELSRDNFLTTFAASALWENILGEASGVDTIDFTHREAGVRGNSAAIAEVATNVTRTDFTGGAEGTLDDVAAWGTITFAGLPADEEIITITDYYGQEAVFEFDSTGALAVGVAYDFPRASVTIGVSAALTAASLAAAINASGLLLTAAVATFGGNSVVYLTHNNPGTKGSNATVVTVATNVTATATFSGGVAKTEDAVMMEFRVMRGGPLHMEFKADEMALSITVQIRTATGNWVTVAAATHGEAIDAVALQALTTITRDIKLREGVDARLRVLSSGGGTCNMQLRHSSLLSPVEI